MVRAYATQQSERVWQPDDAAKLRIREIVADFSIEITPAVGLRLGARLGRRGRARAQGAEQGQRRERSAVGWNQPLRHGPGNLTGTGARTPMVAPRAPKIR